MRNILVLLATMFTVISAQAGDHSKLGITSEDTAAIETQLKDALTQHTGKNLKHFAVNFSSLKCNKLDQTNIDPDVTGICSVNLSAYQLAAKAVIIKKYDGYSVSIIYVNESYPT